MIEHKISAAIVAATEEEAKKVASELNEIEEIALVGSSADLNRARSVVQNNLPQLVFVDVRIDHSSGLEFIQKLYCDRVNPEVVFMARSDSKAYDALAFEPLDYLIKPIQRKDINDVLSRLKVKLKREALKRKMDIYARHYNISVKRVFHQSKGIIVLYLDEIVNCKAERSKTVLKLVNNEEVVVKTNLTETTKTIDDPRFFRISRSNCINRTYLRKIDKKKAKCLLQHDGNYWELSASRNSLNRLESLYSKPLY